VVQERRNPAHPKLPARLLKPNDEGVNVFEEWEYKEDKWKQEDTMRVLRALAVLAVVLVLALAKLIGKGDK